MTISTNGTNVSLLSIQFNAAVNGLVSGGGLTNSPGNQYVPLNSTSFSFTVARATGGVATTVPFVVTDSCGSWPSFVGGGPSAF